MTSPIGDHLLGITLPGVVDEQGHHKVHPLTPIVHAVAVIPAVAGAVILLGLSNGFVWLDVIPGTVIGTVIGTAVIALIVAVAVGLYQYLAWRVLAFWFDTDGDFRVLSGVLIRKERRVQISRIQAIDVVQPLAARLFGMAALVIEVAGQDDSRVRLKYLTVTDAREIRREILARAAGLHHQTAEAPQTSLLRVATRDLALSLLLRSSTAFLLLGSVGIIVVSFLFEGWSGLALLVVTGGVPLLVVVSEFLRYYGFTVAESPDGLRLRFGLLRTETRTVPPGRVQAIDFVEPLFWRPRGWTRVRVNIAGVGGSNSDGGNSQAKETLLIPVATIAQARALVARVLPDLNVDALEWHPAPRRAWRRSPIQWMRLAIAWDSHAFAIRRGRITRHLAAVPHARTQSVRFTQGPWERALDLASVHVDTTPGPVSITGLHLDRAFAADVCVAQAERARLARTQDTTVHWARYPIVTES